MRNFVVCHVRQSIAILTTKYLKYHNMKKNQLTHLRWLILSLLLATGVGSAWGQTTDTYTFTSKAWAANPANWTSGKDGNQMTTDRGVQVTTGASGANGTSSTSFSNVSQVVVTYSTNANAGAGSIAIQVGSNTAVSQNVTKTGGTTDRTLTYTFSPLQSGKVKITVTCTTNSIYVKSVAITYGSTPKTETEVTFLQESYDTSIPGTFSAPTATVRNKNTAATISGATVSYESSNTTVATVNSSTGAVTLKGPGTTTITATYEGNNTYEGSTGSYTLNVADGRTATTMTFPSNNYEAILGESFTSPTATLNPSTAGSLTYSSSNASVATVNSSTGEVSIVGAGTTIITASFAGNNTYKASSATYTLKVSSGSGGSSFTWDLSKQEYDSADENAIAWSNTFATMNYAKASGSTTSANNYIPPTRTSTRFYTNGTLTIAPASGYKIKSIEFTATTDSYASTFKGSTWTNATASVSGTTVTVTPTSGTSAIVATIGGTCGFTDVTVYYEPTSSTAPDAPTLTPSCTFWPKTNETATKVITIAPTTQNSIVRYTTDGTDPSTSNGNIVTASTNVTVSGTTTVKAIAYVGTATSGIATATYTLGQTVNSIAAFKDLTTGTEARLYLSPEQNARVLHYSGNEIYLRDNTGAICLYLNSSLQKTIPAHDYHVAGWIIGMYQPYNGLPEMVATSNTTTAYLAFAAPVTEEATSPVAISADDFDNYKADWVTITDLRAESNNNVTDDAGNTFKVYNKYGLNADSYYQDLYDYALVDLTGLAIPYNNDKEIVPIYYNNVRPIVYVIDENKDFTSPGNDIQNVTVRLVRTLSASNWNTFAIPFDIPDFNGRVRKYDHAEGTTMVFVDDYIEAGKPYLVKPEESIVNPVFTNVTLSATPPQNVEEGDYSFNAIYSPTNIYSADRTNRFLKTDGYLYYPSSETAGRLKGMRAYFVVPAGASNIKVNPDGTATAIDDLIIMNDLRDNKVYDVSGRMVSNDLRSLPRGIYIVNGKKIVVR